MKNYAVLNSLKRINSYNKIEAQYVILINTTSLIRSLKRNTSRPKTSNLLAYIHWTFDVQIPPPTHPSFPTLHQGLSISTYYYMPDMPTMQKIIVNETLVASTTTTSLLVGAVVGVGDITIATR
jgi:hypothetical protein